MENKFCYDCGEPLEGLSKEEINKEHIPAKCLFRGYEDQFTHDLITIKAKKSCNSSYSHIDDELRNFVAILTDGKDNQKMLEKTFNSIARKEMSRFKPDDKGLAVSFDYNTILQLNEKNFKGLYYYEYGIPFPGDKFKIFNITETEDRDKLKEFSRFLYARFIKPLDWKISGHEDVFRYRIIMLKQKDNDLAPTDDSSEMKVCICAMHYYKKVFALSMGIEIEWAEKLMGISS